MKHKLARSIMLALSLLLITSMIGLAAPVADATTKTLSTNYTVMNLSTTNDATVTVMYKTDTGGDWTASSSSTSFTVAKNYGQNIVAQYFDASMAAGKGSAVLSSTEPLAAIVQILARNQTPSSGAYSGFTSGSNKFYAPLVQAKLLTAGGTSNAQIMIQNIGNTALTNVTVDFFHNPILAGITDYQKTGISIPAYSTYYYDLSNETNLEAQWSGSAVVTADTGKSVAVVVNLFAGANTLTTYNAYPVESIGQNWAIPLFTSRLPNGLNTSVSVQNVSGSTMASGSITLDCKSTLSSPATFSKASNADVANNAGFGFNPFVDTSIPGNWTGACTVHAPGDAVVQVTLRSPGVSDNSGAYEAFNSSSTNTMVVVPLMSKRQANGFATVATIQNLDTANAATVDLTYTPSTSYGGSQTPITLLNQNIPAGGNLIQNLRFNDVPQVPNGWFGTLVVTPSPSSTARPLVAFLQLTNYLGSAGDTLMCHDAFSLP
jgi:hypothetical protein